MPVFIWSLVLKLIVIRNDVRQLAHHLKFIQSKLRKTTAALSSESGISTVENFTHLRLGKLSVQQLKKTVTVI